MQSAQTKVESETALNYGWIKATAFHSSDHDPSRQLGDFFEEVVNLLKQPVTIFTNWT